MSKPNYKRVLLKLSGEAFAGPDKFGIDIPTVLYIAQQVAEVHAAGLEAAVVVGGGNYVRGSHMTHQTGIDQTVTDQMGMLGTLMNALALQAALEKLDVPTRVQSAIQISQVAETFIRRRAVRHLEKGRVVIFAAGTGNPYFTTDSASVLRALEIDADCLLKATKVDGIYDKDPMKHSDAVRYEYIDYSDAISQKLAVMDQTAFTMCSEHKLPVIVLNLNSPGAMLKAIQGEKIGTLVGESHVRH